MPDTVERTIYELVLDDQGFIRAIEGANASLQKLIQTQNQAAQTLRTNEAQFKSNAERIADLKRQVELFTGTNESARKQTQQFLDDAIENQKKLIGTIRENQKAYDDATKAAQEFADTAKRAASVAGPTGVVATPGLIPAPPQTVTPIANAVTQTIGGIQASGVEATDIAGTTQDATEHMKLLAEAVQEVEKSMVGLNTQSDEFKQLSIIAETGKAVMQALREVAEGTYTSFQKIPKALADMQARLAALQPATAPLTEIEAKVRAFGTGVAAFKPQQILDQSQITFVKQLSDSTKELDTTTQSFTKHQVSLRQQILNNNNELARMVQAGEENTEQYKKLEIETARLNQLYREQRERIAVLSSETRGLNFGKAAIQTAISGFQALTAVEILVGDKSEKLQKQTMQLFAAMQLLSAIEQTTIQLRRGGTIATELQTAAMASYKFVVDATNVSLKVWRGLLVTTGIGAAIAVIALLVTKFQQMREAAAKANEENKRMGDLIEKSGSAAGNAQAQLNKLTIEIRAAREGHLSAKDALNDFNETIGKTVGHTNDLATAEKKLIELGPAYVQLMQMQAQAQAAAELGAEATKKLMQDQVKQASDFVGAWDRFWSNDPAKQRLNAKKKALKDDQDAVDFWFNKQKEITQQAIDFANKNKLNYIPKPEVKDKKEIENVFDQEFAALTEKLAELRRTEETTFAKINAEYVAKLQSEKLRIAKELKEKKLTEVQAEILVNLAIKINQVELNKALADFKKKIDDARQKINDTINQRQTQSAIEQASLIQDEFERRRQEIEINEKKEVDDRIKLDRDAIDQLREQRRQGVIKNDTDLQTEEMKVITTGQQLIQNIYSKFNQQREKLAVDSFENILNGYKKAFDQSQLTEDQTTAGVIRQLSDQFISGKITAENFQKELTIIQEDAADERRGKELEMLKNQLTDLDQYIATYSDKTSKFYKDLLDQRTALSENIAQKETEDAIADANRVKKQETAFKDAVSKAAKYAEATNAVVQQVGEFWSKTNDFEQRALDRSIQLQETRVNEAQRIADRGNAAYLKSETDRLNQLQVERENAARKQMGVDAALQGSNILTGITGAIAKISSGIGTAEAIAEVAVIIGLLATGYSLVKTLSANQPKLKKGTKYLQRGDHPAGVDTIPVMANEGEAVLPTEINRVYHPTVTAIYDQKIPPDIVNKFVHNYVNKQDQSVENVRRFSTDSVKNFTTTYNQIKPVHSVSWTRIKEAADIHVASDARLQKEIREQNKLLVENNDLQRQIFRALKTMGVNVNMDKNGIAVSVLETIEEIEKSKYT